MATFYVRSTTGSNANNGSTWALAKATVAGALSAAAAGDTIWVSQVHAESTASTITWTGGALTTPTKIICGNDGAQPPTALATTATVTTTGASNIDLNSNLYVYGITFNVGTGTSGGSMDFGANAHSWIYMEQCQFIIVNNFSASGFFVGNLADADDRILWKNCNIKSANAGNTITQLARAGIFHWNGGSIVSGGTTPTVLVTPVTGSNILIENVDFTNYGNGVNLTAATKTSANVTFRNCKMPASWSGALLNGTFGTTNLGQVSGYNISTGSANYKLWTESVTGSVNDETTFVRSGGASDGTTPLSWKMVTTANTSYPYCVLDTPEFVLWNDTTGSSKTVTVEILRDSATNLKDNEIWIEVNYFSSASIIAGALVVDRVDVGTGTAADLPASSVTWTTSGMANPNKQKVAVTFTPNLVGFFMAKVKLAKASTTVYVDPYLTVT